MAKQVKKFGPVVVMLAVVTVLVILSFAQSDPPTGGPGEPGGPPAPIPINPELACAVREALGFGPVDLLPGMAGKQQHQEMIGAAIGFCAEDEEQLAALVADCQQADTLLVHALTWDEDTDAVYEQIAAARGALAQAAQGMLPVLSQSLTADQAGLTGQVVQNLALDPELRTKRGSNEKGVRLLFHLPSQKAEQGARLHSRRAGRRADPASPAHHDPFATPRRPDTSV